MKSFKRIYVEISNYCNLDCVFCTTKKNTRKMSVDDFRLTCNKLKGYTKEIVLHVLGEPLVHKDIIEMVNIAKEDFKVMITTNGFLLNKFHNKDFINFSKMNISVHSSYYLNKEEKKKYLNNIFEFIEYAFRVNPNVVFNLRLWANSNIEIKEHNEFLIDYINKYYNVDILSNPRIKKHVVVTFDSEFKWPSLDNNYNSDKGTCKGGKTHIAILSNGNVGICCLDSEATSKLGNIFIEDLDTILNKDIYKNTISGFNQNKLFLDICKHCEYHDRKE